jgi:hypothetical protein
MGNGKRAKLMLGAGALVAAGVFGGLTVAGGEGRGLPPGVGQSAPAETPVRAVASDVGRTEEYTAIAPCRVFDTREQAGPLVNGTRSFDVSGNLTAQGGSSSCGIPTNATSIAINLTGISTGSTGFVRGWAAGTPPPTATLLNFGPAINVSNQVNIPLCKAGPCPNAFTLRAFGSTHIVGDAVGYFTAPMYANVTSIGGIRASRSSGVVSTTRTSIGEFTVTFDRDLTGCAVQATDLRFDPINEISADFSASDVFVNVKDLEGNQADTDFFVTVTC